MIDVSVITRYQLQSMIKEISEVPLRFCGSSPTNYVTKDQVSFENLLQPNHDTLITVW